MSYADEKLRDGLRNLVARNSSIMAGTVTAVDAAQYTCTIARANGVTYQNVQLKALKNAPNGIVAIPALNSYVQFIELADPDYLVIAAEEVNKYMITIGGTTAVLDANSIVWNGGGKGGVPTSPELVQRLNKIEQDINNLKTVMSGWTPIVMDGGLSLKTAAASWYAQPLTPTQQTDIENPKIKQ